MLLVEFECGQKMTYDVKPLTTKWQAFQALIDNSLFRSVIVDPGGYGISWNNHIDLACEELWENGLPAEGMYQ